eukprot:EG_transcript_17879
MASSNVPTEAEEKKMLLLRLKWPESPEEELLRFCRARPQALEEAVKMYEAYLEWRKGQGAPDNLLKYVGTVPAAWVRTCGHAVDGTPAAYCQGARFDPNLPAENYVLYCANLIDSVVKANDMTRITILIDVRAGNGDGWFNAPPHQMVSFFRLANQILNVNYPERAQRLIIYPIPTLLTHLWTMFSAILDKVTKEKFIVLSGSAVAGAPCPPKLLEYIKPDQFPPDAQPLHQLVTDLPPEEVPPNLS